MLGDCAVKFGIIHHLTSKFTALSIYTDKVRYQLNWSAANRFASSETIEDKKQLACLHDQNKWLFWRAGFYPANHSNLKSILKGSDWLEKATVVLIM